MTLNASWITVLRVGMHAWDLHYVVSCMIVLFAYALLFWISDASKFEESELLNLFVIAYM